MKKKERLIKKNIVQDAFRSVQKPSAQYTILCDSSMDEVVRSNEVVELLTTDNSVSVLEKAVIELMFISGCRISQAISIKSSDISVSGKIRIKGSKGSDDIIAFPTMFRDFWTCNKNFISSVFIGYNRFYFYRLFKKKGLIKKLEHKINWNVTHSLRQLYIESLKNSEFDDELIKKSIGHKSIKSQEFYINKK